MGFMRFFPKVWSGRQWLSVILLLSIIPVLFFGTILYSTGTRIVEDEVDRASQHSITQMKDQMDILTRQIEQFSNQFSLQTNVTELLDIGATPSIGSLPLTLTLVNDLSLFAYLLNAVDSAYLYHVAQNTVIYPDGVTTFGNAAMPDTSWLEEVKRIAATGKRSFWIAPRPIVKYAAPSGTTLSYIRVLPNLTQEMKAVLVINIKESYVRQLLQNFPLGTDGGVLVFNERNVLITSSGAYGDLDADELANITSRWAGAAPASVTSRISHPDAFVTYSRSSVNGWTYALLIPANAPVKSVQSLKLIIVATTAALSLLALFTSYFSFKRLMNGIRRIWQVLNRGGEENTPSEDMAKSLLLHGNIEQIEQKIARLIDENRGYELKNLKQDAVMRNNYLHALLLGQIGAAEESGNGPSLPASFTHSRFSAFVIEMDTAKPGSPFGDNDEPLFLYAAANLARELLSEFAPTETVLTPKRAIAVLNVPDALTDRDIAQAAEFLRETTLKILKHSVTISVGRTVSSLKELTEAYDEANLTLQRRWLGDGNEVVLPGGTVRSRTTIGHYPIVWEDRMFRLIRSGDQKGTREALKQFFEELTVQDLPFSQLKTFCLQLLVSAARIFGNDQEVMDGRKLYDEFMRLNSIPEISKWMTDVLADALPPSIQKLNKRQKDDIEGKVLRLIEERYAQDLSLQLVAEECGVSTSYLSELFKNSTGVTFIQYVTDFRVKKAKHLLLHTDLNISQIAEAIGYSNAPQLIRVFKKTTGTTPGEFRTMQGDKST